MNTSKIIFLVAIQDLFFREVSLPHSESLSSSFCVFQLWVCQSLVSAMGNSRGRGVVYQDPRVCNYLRRIVSSHKFVQVQFIGDYSQAKSMVARFYLLASVERGFLCAIFFLRYSLLRRKKRQTYNGNNWKTLFAFHGVELTQKYNYRSLSNSKFVRFLFVFRN